MTVSIKFSEGTHGDFGCFLVAGLADVLLIAAAPELAALDILTAEQLEALCEESRPTINIRNTQFVFACYRFTHNPSTQFALPGTYIYAKYLGTSLQHSFLYSSRLLLLAVLIGQSELRTNS